ncbi:hypothetical protein O988_06165 [Pseudogymnoascus sp. VKM F-3808]|nr:hypothetical protein O988_06165 [Pseudogymnoascus sp. VKM F-3808]
MAPKRKLVFITNREHGASNVHLAVSYEILVNHPDVEIRFVSFPSLEKHVRAVSDQARKQVPAKANFTPIIFHSLPGTPVTDALEARFKTAFYKTMMHPPGFSGALQSYKLMGNFATGWPGEMHLQIYAATAGFIKDINPLLVVLDPVFVPGIEACRDLKMKPVMLSPNAMKDILAQQQPRGKMLWKYPAIASGFPYPLPLYLIPVNIYLIFRLILSLVLSKSLSAKNAYMKKNGHNPAIPFTAPANDDTVTWLVPSLPEIDLPLAFIPKNAIPCGPIIMEFAPVADIDAELASWLARRPTVLINLGTLYKFDEGAAKRMLGAIEHLLEKIKDVQVLWKLSAEREEDAWVGEMRKLARDDGRLRIEKWISAEIAAVLASDTVVLAVHHGGASSYHEAICAGKPQIILPMWVDLYDFATRVEYLGIGLWPTKSSAPSWNATELGAAMVRIVEDSEESRAMRRRAEELKELCRKNQGRKVAAERILEMM